ncbi:MAG: radical SAM protein [Proteobacteria bacterium]|nr:radical SAM protein [Pseudomonadota bacterium]
MAEKVDILFINPGEPAQIYQGLGDEFCAIEPPVFAGLFATYARKRGASVAIIDGPAERLSSAKVAEMATGDFDPTLVVVVVYGFQPSASTQNMTAAGRVARLIHETRPDVKIMMTGTHLAALPQRSLAEESIDFVCDREGPVTIYRTMMALKAGETDFSKVPSLWWRDGGRIVQPTESETLLADLDAEMPGIAWDLMDPRRYRSHNWHAFDHIHDRSPYAAIHTSLGCPYKCSFCCINAPFGKSSYRMWSPDVVIAEIDHLVGTYGVKNIKFVDEMFVLNKRHVLGICDRLIERDYKVNIWAYARVDTVQDQFLDKLQRAGFNWLCLGIESASADVRDGAAKKYQQEDIADVVRRIQNAGIHVLGNFIFGLPEDNRQRMQQTLDMALELNCEFANFYSAMAYPGSPLYKMALESGIELPEKWHHFSQHGYESKPLSTKYCSAAEILAFRDEAWNGYFTSPTYLALVERKFGRDVVDHVSRMTQIPLQRKLLEKVAA